jgi:transposase
MNKASTIGLDLAKQVFQVHGADATGAVVFRKRLRRTAVLQFFASQAPCRVAMEACASSHYWGRELSRIGHEVRLIPPAYVKPFVKRQKNDAADAEAICEASQRPTMRFVQIKSETAQAAAVVFRVRDLLVRQRTQIINALRGHLAEFGLVVPTGPAHVGRLLAEAEDYARSLPQAVRPILGVLIEALHSLDEKIAVLDVEISRRAEEDEDARRLKTIPGIGPVTAAAISALAPPAQTFARGRDFAAWLGLTPLQRSTGGKQKLGGTSKRGAHNTPPIDHRGERCCALGCAKGSSCRIMVGAHACSQAAYACGGGPSQQDGTYHLGLAGEGWDLSSFDRGDITPGRRLSKV